MTKAKVFVQGRAYNEVTASVFRSNGPYQIVKNLSEADIVVFTGGEDICPALYGEKPIPGTSFSDRDIDDLEAVKQALAQSKFLVGICRGAQLLNVVPNGGSLWQDVDGHDGCKHRAFDCVTGKWILVNSIHHQMMRITDKAEILCWAAESTYRESEHERIVTAPGRHNSIILEKDKDIEACWYPKTESLCMQFHIEFGHAETTAYGMSLIDKFYWNRFEERKIA